MSDNYIKHHDVPAMIPYNPKFFKSALHWGLVIFVALKIGCSEYILVQQITKNVQMSGLNCYKKTRESTNRFPHLLTPSTGNFRHSTALGIHSYHI